MDIRLIFRNHQRSFAPQGVAWGEVIGGWLAQVSRVQELIPGGSNGMTRCGSSSAFWLYVSKPVGGEDRQIRPLIQPRAASVRDFCPVSSEPCWQEKCLARPTVSVPQSDTGRRVENTKAIGRIPLNEIRNMAP